MTELIVDQESRNLPSIKGLMAKGPDPELEEKLMLFGQFVGDWDLDVWMIPPGGSRIDCKAEVSFRWILRGKAIQDVWAFRNAKNTIGTTVRFYDPKIDAWRCVWANPVSGIMETLIGREKNKEIILEGTTYEGFQQRWTYTDITPDSFTWRGYESRDGETWQLQEEMKARRRDTVQ